MQVRAYNTVDGKPVEGDNVVPVSAVSWQMGWNEPDRMTLTIPLSMKAAVWGLRTKLRPWKASCALLDGDDVIVAGPVLNRKWSLRSGLTVVIGGGWDLMRKRLVLNPVLKTSWVDGEVVIDEDNPAPRWVVQFAGKSLASIGAGLVRLAVQWGPLNIDSPSLDESGIHVRTYLASALATVSDRLKDLTEVIGGPRIHFEPYVRADGHLRFRYVADQGSVHIHRASTAMRGHGVQVVEVDEDGETMATDVYALGGRDDDISLVARSSSALLTDAGWPVLMEGLRSHSSVSRLDTLKGHTDQGVVDGARVPESTQFQVRASRRVRPGDQLDVTTTSTYHGQIEQLVDVVDVTGSLSEWCTVTGFPQEVE